MRFVSTQTVAAASLSLTLPAAFFSLGTTAKADLLPGDVLVNDLSAPNGTTPASYGNITQYRNGSLVQTYAIPGASTWEGVGLTPGGDIVTTYRQPTATVAIFNPSGSLVKSFSIADQTSAPGDVSVFSDGVIAISDQVHGQVLEYDQNGNYLRALQPSYGINPFGNTATSGNSLWIADPSGKNVYEFDELGNELHNFQVLDTNYTPFTPGDLVVSGGNLYVTDRNINVYQIPINPSDPSNQGLATNVLDASQGTGTGRITGIALAGDGSLYVGGEDVGSIQRFDTSPATFGALLGSFALSNPDQPLFIEAVAVPEPATLSMLGLAAVAVFRRRRA